MDFGKELEALAERLYGADLSRKPTSYLAEYDRLFRPIRRLPLRLLELGVQRGISMLLWREYFLNAIIVGLDVSPKPENFPEEPRFHFVQGSQDDPATLDEAAARAGGPFDIIIDDASHLGFLTGRSFAYLFPSRLKPGGIYVIEDICTAFFPAGDFDATEYCPAEIGLPGMPRVFPGHQHGMVGLVKQLFDHTMAPTALSGYTRFAIERMTVLSNIVFFEKAR
jgi:hypothetical protein